MNDMTVLEKLVTPDKVDADGYHIGKQVIPYGRLAEFQTAQRAIGGTEKQLAVLADVRDGKLPADRPLVSPTGMTAEKLLAGATPDASGNMKIGSLNIQKDVYDDFKRALTAQGPKDPEMVALFEHMANDKTRTHTIRRTDGADSRAPGGDVVWDPSHGGVDYYNEAKMSPARALKHEAVHATQDPDVQRVLQGVPDKMYGNLEEKNAEKSEARGMDKNSLMRGSHYSNIPYTAKNPIEAPQTCEHAELMVHTKADNQGPIKGPGLDISGTVTGIEHKGGVTTLSYRTGGRDEAISFPETTYHNQGDPGQRNPLNNVTENVQVGDAFGLKIGRDGNAAFTNTTQGIQEKICPDGRTEGTSLDFSKSQTPSLSR